MPLSNSIRASIVALVFVTSASAITQYAHALPPCTDMTISNSGGSTIRMRNGQTFTVFNGTSGRIMSWLPGNNVSVCPLGGTTFQITNIDRNNQTVRARR
jgi:hypothetical protein